MSHRKIKIKEAKKLLENGLKTEEIQKRLHLHPKTVDRLLRQQKARKNYDMRYRKINIECWSCGCKKRIGQCIGCERSYCPKCQVKHDCPAITIVAKQR